MPAAPHVAGRRLPEVLSSLTEAMDVAGNGEVFWFGECAADGARWLAGLGLAIVGGEVYLRHPVAWATYLGGWTLEPQRGHDESWEAWVERGLVRAIGTVADGWPGANADSLRYFFACVPRPEPSAHDPFI